MKIESYIDTDGETKCIRAYDNDYAYDRAEVGIDGNCGYALLGPNIQEGECEFVEIEGSDDSDIDIERRAWGKALFKLSERLGGHISYFVKS